MSGEEKSESIARRERNLVPITTTEMAKEKGRKGGLAKKGSVHLTKYMEQMFFTKFPVLIDGKKGNWGKAINTKLFERAAKGDLRAIEIVYDRLLGKAKQQIEAKLLDVEGIQVDWGGPPPEEKGKPPEEK